MPLMQMILLSQAILFPSSVTVKGQVQEQHTLTMRVMSVTCV